MWSCVLADDCQGGVTLEIGSKVGEAWLAFPRTAKVDETELWVDCGAPGARAVAKETVCGARETACLAIVEALCASPASNDVRSTTLALNTSTLIEVSDVAPPLVFSLDASVSIREAARAAALCRLCDCKGNETTECTPAIAALAARVERAAAEAERTRGDGPAKRAALFARARKAAFAAAPPVNVISTHVEDGDAATRLLERLAPDSGANLRGAVEAAAQGLYSTTILGDTTLGGLGPLDVDNHTGPVSTVVVALAGGEHGHSMVLKATTHGIAARECARLRRLEPINVAPRAFGSRYGHGWSACAMERLGDEYDTLAQLREADHYFDRDSTAAALARAIAAVNDAGIRHRDVNPANVLVRLDADRRCLDLRLVDFSWAGGGDDAPDIARWWAPLARHCNTPYRPQDAAFDAFDADICAVRAVFKDVDFETINEAGHSVDVESRGGDKEDDDVEQHLLIDWRQHIEQQELVARIRDADLGVHDVRVVRAIVPPNRRVEVISDFYGVLVDDARGATDFTIYFVDDARPRYEYRSTTKGVRRVNAKLFDLKARLRAAGIWVHATDNIQETKDNLRALGIYEDFYRERRFGSLREAFEHLNRAVPRFEYVVLRNFEPLEAHVAGARADAFVDEHLDVDLLCTDYYVAKRLLDGDVVRAGPFAGGPILEDGGYRILNHVWVNGSRVYFDLRFIGDDYYDEKWQRAMVAARHQNVPPIYVPDRENWLHALIYHALVHKSAVSPTYRQTFQRAGIHANTAADLRDLLETFMKEKKYSFTYPNDLSVDRNLRLLLS